MISSTSCFAIARERERGGGREEGERKGGREGENSDNMVFINVSTGLNDILVIISINDLGDHFWHYRNILVAKIGLVDQLSQSGPMTTFAMTYQCLPDNEYTPLTEYGYIQ